MKMPEVIVTYCPYCKRHTEHKVKQEVFRKVRRSLSKGQRRAKRRSKGHGNHGRYSKKPISEWKLRSKTTKKVDLLLICSECGKAHHKSLRRLKRFEIIKR